jgi:hypothetical protein
MTDFVRPYIHALCISNMAVYNDEIFRSRAVFALVPMTGVMRDVVSGIRDEGE